MTFWKPPSILSLFACQKHHQLSCSWRCFHLLDASRFFSAKKTGSAWSIDANLMVPALSSCSEYQGIHFPLEPTKKWQHDATCMRFLLGIVGMFRLHKNTTADCVCILCTMIRPNMWSIRSVVRVPWDDFFTPLVSPSCSPPSVKKLGLLKAACVFWLYVYIYTWQNLDPKGR